jgi:hypothetical protein
MVVETFAVVIVTVITVIVITVTDFMLNVANVA